MKFIALPYYVDQNIPSVPLHDLVDTPADYRDIAFKTAFNVAFDCEDDDIKVIIESGEKSRFGDFTICDTDRSMFVFFTEVLGH